MTLGLTGFFAVYFVLFALCLRITDVDMFYGQVFAAYAIGRLLTAVGVTPGGLGVTETATAAALVAWGADPANATAAVVLFSVYTHLMEIPLGAMGWLAWSVSPKTTPVDEHVPEGALPTPSPGGGPDAAGPGRPPRRPG
jgi:uncharacterized membrane protein YbhN (UPF0104 family)